MKIIYKIFFKNVWFYAGFICLLITITSCVSETEKKQLDSLQNEVAWMETQIEELDRQESEMIAEKALQDSIQREEKTKLKPSHIIEKTTLSTFWFSPNITKNLVALGFSKGKKKEKTFFYEIEIDIISTPFFRTINGNSIKINEIYYGEEDGDEDYYITLDFNDEKTCQEFLDEIRKNFNPKENGDKLTLNDNNEVSNIIVDYSRPLRLVIYSEYCRNFPRL